MDTEYKVVTGSLIALLVLIFVVIFATGKAAVQNSNRYEQACAERNGVTVYNGKHYECFVKG